MTSSAWVAVIALAVSVLVNLHQARSKGDQMHEDIGYIKGQLLHTASKEDIANVRADIAEVRADIAEFKAEVLNAVKNERPA